MPIERYYLNKPLNLQETIPLQGPELHHLARVMRSQVGDRLDLVNGEGVLAHGVITSLDKSRAMIQIEKVIYEKRSSTKIILAQALPKLNRLDFILEKGTELGVDEFWLFPGQQSIKKEFSANQVDRAKAITVAAMKQCGRLSLPKVNIHPALNKWTQFDEQSFYGDVETDAPLFLNEWQSKELSSSITFFIGPESGWSVNEIGLLKRSGVRGVKLHDNILRTDTASLVALSLIRYHLIN